jgi:hypothetical protein
MPSTLRVALGGNGAFVYLRDGEEMPPELRNAPPSPVGVAANPGEPGNPVAPAAAGSQRIEPT